MFQAGCRLAGFWESHFKRLDRTLNMLLASDALSGPIRADVLIAKRATLRDAKLLTEHEAELVAAYRKLSSKGRSAIREMAQWAVKAADDLPRPD
jgi:hypothetical protein